MSITINADDLKTIRAVELAAEAQHWLRGHNREGEEVFGVPSQSDPSRYYIVTRFSCDCPFFRNAQQSGTTDASGERGACKHMLAVRLHHELVKAQQALSRPRRQQPAQRTHLTLLSKSDAEAGPGQ